MTTKVTMRPSRSCSYSFVFATGGLCQNSGVVKSLFASADVHSSASVLLLKLRKCEAVLQRQNQLRRQKCPLALQLQNHYPFCSYKEKKKKKILAQKLQVCSFAVANIWLLRKLEAVLSSPSWFHRCKSVFFFCRCKIKQSHDGSSGTVAVITNDTPPPPLPPPASSSSSPFLLIPLLSSHPSVFSFLPSPPLRLIVW